MPDPPVTAAEIGKALKDPFNFPTTKRAFSPRGDNGYELRYPDVGVIFEVDYVRRDRAEVSCQLTVRTTLPTAKVVYGTDVISMASFNLSSSRTRDERAKHLSERSGTPGFEWRGAVEELCQHVLHAERLGTPPTKVTNILAHVENTSEWVIHGLPVLRYMPTLWFGDGGSAKSYLALVVASALSDQDIPVLFCDWEMYGGEQRARLQRLCGDRLPALMDYLPCAGSIAQESSRIRAAVLDRKIGYVIFDSVAVACGGAPESAEMAGEYHRVIQSLGPVGTLHIAHISKQHEDAPDPSKPFGSVFWSNFARSTWLLKRANGEDEDDHIDVACFQKKCNATKRHRPVGIRLTFTDRRVVLASFSVRDHKELATTLPLWQRLETALKHGPRDPDDLAEALGVAVNHLRSTVSKHPDRFTRIPNGRLALVVKGLVEEDGEF